MVMLALTCVVASAQAQNNAVMGTNRVQLPGLGNTMNFDSCMDFSWRPRPDLQAALPHFDDGHPCCDPVPIPCGFHRKCCKPNMYNEGIYSIDYWEPSALIEVSCRNAYSVLKPGLSGRGEAAIQSCMGPVTSNGSKRWFFEARVWALDGYIGRARHQSSGGSVKAEQARKCTMAGDDTTKGEYWGYGKKYDKFTKGPPNGPGQSWEAYVSDGDKSWAEDSGNVQQPPTQQACRHGDVDVEKCWGPMGGAGAENGGWVSAPNQTVAAALVAWRAHTKALNMRKVSPAGSGGFKMDMDYPFLYATSPYASAMGLAGGDQMKGSKCFKPGDAGPEWYSHNEQNMTVDQIVDQVQHFQAVSGSAVTTAAEVQPGIFIFTVWVHTDCTRFKISGGKPGPLCKYQGT